jgi:hypothetical protein
VESRSIRRGKGGTTLCPTIKSNFLTVKGKENCSNHGKPLYKPVSIPTVKGNATAERSIPFEEEALAYTDAATA